MCRALVDEVKASVPIWKHQVFLRQLRGVGGGGAVGVCRPRRRLPGPSAPGSRSAARRRPGCTGRDDPQARGSRRTGERWWRPWTPLAIGIVLAFVGGVAASVVPLPYAVLQPGPATNVLGNSKGPDGADVPRIMNKARTYPTSGALDFTTVRVLGLGYGVNAVDLLVAWLSPTQDVYPVDDIFRRRRPRSRSPRRTTPRWSARSRRRPRWPCARPA